MPIVLSRARRSCLLTPHVLANVGGRFGRHGLIIEGLTVTPDNGSWAHDRKTALPSRDLDDLVGLPGRCRTLLVCRFSPKRAGRSSVRVGAAGSAERPEFVRECV